MEIKINNLCKSFGGNTVFSDFCVTVPEGITAIMAGSGIGKTTLLRILAGIDKSYGGDISGVGTVSYCPQEVLLFPWYSARKNLKIVLLREKDPDKLIEDGLYAFGLSEAAEKKPHEMSGGMCQRIAVLRAWLYPSDTVILDEPFKGLDKDTKERVIDYLKRTRHPSRNVIFTTHSTEEAEIFVDSVIRI